MNEILTPVIALGSLGLIFGVVLSFASKKFCVKTDPRVEEILQRLPGANCGACGKAGCIGFTEALVHGDCAPDACPVASEENREEIDEILGIAAEKKVKRVAVMHCGGANKVKNKFNYQGLKTCHAANLVFGGPKECIWACLGYDDCAQACPFDAITMKGGLPVIDVEKCKSCGICAKACPKDLFTINPVTKNVHVLCKSQDIGKLTNNICKVGCIGCMLCQKKCQFDAIHIINNCAVIDYEKCTACGECIIACPQKTIALVRS